MSALRQWRHCVAYASADSLLSVGVTTSAAAKMQRRCADGPRGRLRF